MSADDSPGLYVESTIIMTTVRVVAPFVLTFALFVSFHGADSPGGGFQGGVIAGSVIMMLAFAFGTDATREWIDTRAIAVLGAAGVLLFAAIGLGGIALGGTFLEYQLYANQFLKPVKASKYGMELVELGIGGIVASIAVGLFFLLSAGFGHAIDGDGGDEA
jgi:multicomponent Na+:H+ antiporter subunit B